MPRERAEAELLRMVQSLRHESFYEVGTFIEPSLGFYVGWALPKSPATSGLPYRNENDELVLAFSGEEFPPPGTKERLKQSGHTLRGRGSDYVVHLYEEDPKFPAGLNGRIQGFLIDRPRGKALLFNDRYGLHRINYHESAEAFYFAAEAKAILEVRPELSNLDHRSLGEMITCGCVLEDRTLFHGIHVLPAGSLWNFENKALAKRGSYFQQHEWEEQEQLSPEAYYQELKKVFSENLPRYFSGEERIGVSLTGGLDTRMIMAWHKQPAGTLPCYSFGGMIRDCHDVITARTVADACHQPHEVIELGEQFLAEFPHYAERTVYLTEGANTVNRAADLYANEKAREIAPVRMTGNYGGEVLRRVRAFKPMPPAPGLFARELEPHIAEAEKTYAKLHDVHPLSFAVFRQAPWHHYSLLSLEETQLSLRTPYLDNDFVRTVFRAPDSACSSNEACFRLINDGDAGLMKLRTDRGLLGDSTAVVSNLRRAGLEFTFKADYAFDYGMPQWLAKVNRLMGPFSVERQFLGRHKFAHYRLWYRDVLSDYVKAMLLDDRSLNRPYLDGKGLAAMVRSHLAGTGNYTMEIHKALTLEHFHRLFVD